MFSKDWKLALIVTLSATLLTACGSDKKEEGRTNPLAGAWVNTTALKQYDTKIVKQNDESGFCHTALSDRFRDSHGVKRSGSTFVMRPNALSIEANGDVRIFEVIPNASTRAQGNVMENGLYSGSALISDRVPVKASLQVDSVTGVMTAMNLNAQSTEVSKKYVRADRKTVAAYLVKVSDCVAIKNGRGSFRNYEEDEDGYWKPIDMSEDEIEIELPPIQGPGNGHQQDDLSGGKDGFLSDEDLEWED